MKINIYSQIILFAVSGFFFTSCNSVSGNVTTVLVYAVLFLLLIGLLWYTWWKRKRVKAENSSVTKFNNDIQRILAKLETSDEKINALNYALAKIENNEEYNKNRPWRISLLITIYLHMVMVYSEQGNDKKVILLCNDILALNPKHALTYYNRGYTYKKMDKKDEALSDLEKYLSLDTKDRWGLRSDARKLIDEIKQNK